MLVHIEIFKLSSLLKSDNKIERAVEKNTTINFRCILFFFLSIG